MANIWTSKPATEPTTEPASEPNTAAKDDADVADTGLADIGLPSPMAQPDPPAGKPQLSRDQPQPPPPHQPPPPPAPQQIGNPQDSLSLMQLKRIITEFPRVEPVAYAYSYADTASFTEEIDEWFSYNDAEYVRLKRAKDTFERRWKKFAGDKAYTEPSAPRKLFVLQELELLKVPEPRKRCKALKSLLHVCLGVWVESAGRRQDDGEKLARSTATKEQVVWMKTGLTLLAECGGIKEILNALEKAFDRLWDDEYRTSHLAEEDIPLAQEEFDNAMTILYISMEAARSYKDELANIRQRLLEINILKFLTNLVAKLRWDEANELPQTRIFLLFWKAILLTFGATPELNEVKKAISETSLEKGEDASGLITASPLDYHLFRQEITSKYPAYVPPQPLLPLETDNNSILPPLPSHASRQNNGSNGILPPPPNLHTSGASILHQPVHIATPAPSPPPSPPVGGKAGKKQNYQTNQNFPFMYPPLDSTSNSAGGKGGAGLQEQLVGRKWEGSEIPASILEAGQLFAKRMRMTRAMRQLWDERERFMKFERGWDDEEKIDELDLDVDDSDLEKLLTERLEKLGTEEKKPSVPKADYGPNENIPDDVKARLDSVEEFYMQSLPQLQSIVIVLLKAVLANVTALITQPPNGPPTSSFQAGGLNGAGQRRPQDQNGSMQPINDAANLSVDELEALRAREITSKAVSGIFLILLKWFKISHILKFEYLTQLLLDSNYLPLVLKLYAHQEIDRMVDSQSDRSELSFFTFCNKNSKNYVPEDSYMSDETDEASPDEAAPPPIKLKRTATATSPAVLPTSIFEQTSLPAVDELGAPTGPLPATPITSFSARNFLSSINYLRVMQKITKNKAHRNLLLVQYKSSTILKKALKIPQPELRLYTLKLFKGQVPYCGRKWRQGNMRVITAVYLYCRPELREEWLAGSDVDGEVEEALPLEQGLRGLSYWYNVKRFGSVLGEDGLGTGESDFFRRELERWWGEW